MTTRLYMAAMAALMIAACNPPEPGVGERVGKQIDAAAKDAREKLEQAQKDADGAARDAMARTGEALEQAGQRLKESAQDPQENH
ncbi:MAG TPA: hypothetical protein PLQ67_04180 [Burkholderiaceae bacterium]|nr:hypothetical protein [Burkholderiaceae bacterium]